MPRSLDMDLPLRVYGYQIVREPVITPDDRAIANQLASYERSMNAYKRDCREMAYAIETVLANLRERKGTKAEMKLSVGDLHRLKRAIRKVGP